MQKIDIITYANESGHETVTRVTVNASGECSAMRSVGRGIVWDVRWTMPDPVPVNAHMLPEHRDEIAASIAAAIQRFKDAGFEPRVVRGGFTPPTGPAIPMPATFT